MLPQNITAWLYPEFVQTLAEGGFYHASCPKCSIITTVKGEIMINSPKGIVLIPNGPPDKLREVLLKLEIVDTTGKPFSSHEILDKLQFNLKNLNRNPILKKQQEMNDLYKDPNDILEENKKYELKDPRKKRFGLF